MSERQQNFKDSLEKCIIEVGCSFLGFWYMNCDKSEEKLETLSRTFFDFFLEQLNVRKSDPAASNFLSHPAWKKQFLQDIFSQVLARNLQEDMPEELLKIFRGNFIKMVYYCIYNQVDKINPCIRPQLDKRDSFMGQNNYFYDLALKPFLNNLPKIQTLEAGLFSKIDKFIHKSWFYDSYEQYNAKKIFSHLPDFCRVQMEYLLGLVPSGTYFSLARIVKTNYPNDILPQTISREITVTENELPIREISPVEFEFYLPHNSESNQEEYRNT